MLGWRVLLLDDTQVSKCEPSVSRCDVKRELKEFSVKSACKGLGGYAPLGVLSDFSPRWVGVDTT